MVETAVWPPKPKANIRFAGVHRRQITNAGVNINGEIGDKSHTIRYCLGELKELEDRDELPKDTKDIFTGDSVDIYADALKDAARGARCAIRLLEKLLEAIAVFEKQASRKEG